jgi:hypothetical protein
MTALESGERSVVGDQGDAERAAAGAQTWRAALVCYHNPPSGPMSVEWTYWDSRKEARQAAAELTPCGPLCIGVHSAVRLDLMPEPRRRAGRHRPLTAGDCEAER